MSPRRVGAACRSAGGRRAAAALPSPGLPERVLVGPSAQARWGLSPCSSALERVEDGYQGRSEDDYEHCGEDHEDQREEHLDGRLLRLLLGVRPPPLAHLDREIAEDLPDRDA